MENIDIKIKYFSSYKKTIQKQILAHLHAEALVAH